MDVADVVLVTEIAERSEKLAAHDVGEAENGIERRAQLVTNISEKLRIDPTRLLRRIARTREIAHQRAVLELELDERRYAGVRAAGNREEHTKKRDGDAAHQDG